MKACKKVVAVLLSLLTLLSAASFAAGAITFEKDGNFYYLRSHTPTTGDINVLVVRVGFADYPVDDEMYPADSEETIASFFDGSPDSINGFYRTSSYGKLRMSCDTIFTYNAMYDRREYDEENSDAMSSPEGLMLEAFTALDGEIDFDKYDSDGDGYLDVVCFDYAGPTSSYASTWWPHVDTAGDLEYAGKKVDTYTFLKNFDDAGSEVFIHEFGHIFGAADYYSTMNTTHQTIMSWDMMCSNVGDHDGFTKWSYGWLGDDDIEYVEKSTEDKTVTLAPIETDLGDGKKIAVVAPSIDRSNAFFNEYFLVEYDSGIKNNASAFKKYGVEPGFRIFHVIADTAFVSPDEIIDYTHDNTELRCCLIHNVKNEDKFPVESYFKDSIYREGDSLTPEGWPNTGMLADGVYNGLFTGISFTDFVTGDNPSFKVSFSDEPVSDEPVELTLSYGELGADMKMTVTGDKPLTCVSPDKDNAPYLLDGDGNRFPLEMKNADTGVYNFTLYYQLNYPTISPDTEYTLVIPEGNLKYGYNKTVPEFRQTVRSSHFFSPEAIAIVKAAPRGYTRSTLFAVTDSTYGMIYVPMYNDTLRCRFDEYNLNGERVSGFEFELPDYNTTNSTVYKCIVRTLNDGNFALELCTMDNTYFVKIDGSGNILSDVYSVTDNAVYGYSDSVFQIDFDLYKNGLCANLYSSSDHRYLFLSIDFENAPKFEYDDSFKKYYSIDSDTYMVSKSADGKDCLYAYDASDELLFTWEVPENKTIVGAFEDDGKIFVLYYYYDKSKIAHVMKALFDRDGTLTEETDITDDGEQATREMFVKAVSTGSGYYTEITNRHRNKLLAFDSDWTYKGEIDLGGYDDPVIVGVCGLYERTEYIDGVGMANIIFRFNVGDFEIVPARESALLGDADGDGSITINDATLIQRASIDLAELDDLHTLLADVNGDGRVSILDVTWVQKYLAEYKLPYKIGRPVESA